MLDSEKDISKKAIEVSNISLVDLLTNYEISVVKIQSFEKTFHVQLTNLLENPLGKFSKSMEELNSTIQDFNKVSLYKLLQPFEESIIANTIHSYGFQFVSEKDFSKLVIYR